tara:strand:- start:415 stop:1362 length:948 start_codon:yes stop_codon:yes gene_type:complete
MIAPAKRRKSRRSKPKVTVLSFGAGQDSTALLYAIVFDPKIRAKYAPNEFVVVFSDTGDEHPSTYVHLIRIKKFCEKQGIDFFHLLPRMGFHSERWRSLRHQYELNNTCGSKRFMKTCTVNLKINPIYSFLNEWVAENYDYHQYGHPYQGKHALVCFAEDHGQIDVLIGIARGEEKRIDKNGKAVSIGKWFTLAINRVYPLVELGWDRKDCQDQIRGYGKPVPFPSNCMLCPFISKQELLWLARKYPTDFEAWVQFEAAKIEKFAHKGDANIGVFGSRKLLPEILEEAEKQFGDWTIQQLEDYKFSHGHCVLSQY